MSYGVARHAISGVLLAAYNYTQLIGVVFNQPHHLGESRVIQVTQQHLSLGNIGQYKEQNSLE